MFAGLPEIIVCLILRDVLLGLSYIHQKGYIHRSIRASHILINQTKAVLCGFRESCALINNGERTQKLYGLPPNSVKSLNWLAPEVLAQNLTGYTQLSDVYSIGITACELANGLEPFSNMPTTFMLTEKMRGNQPALLDCSTCPDEVLGMFGCPLNYAIFCLFVAVLLDLVLTFNSLIGQHIGNGKLIRLSNTSNLQGTKIDRSFS